MKPLFDPKWLPEIKEHQIPVTVVGPGTHQSLLEDIRRLNQDFPIVDVTVIPSTGRFTPLLSAKPQMRDIVTILDDMDFSELAAPEPKSVINKALRKKREANKSSQNAKGRKWWEHR
jgi:hypothetical protein